MRIAMALAQQPGLLGILPPWGLLLLGVGLLILAGVAFWFNRKVLEEGSCLVFIGGVVCGLGGIVALLVSIFGY